VNGTAGRVIPQERVLIKISIATVGTEFLVKRKMKNRNQKMSDELSDRMSIRHTMYAYERAMKKLGAPEERVSASPANIRWAIRSFLVGKDDPVAWEAIDLGKAILLNS
jgi:hypothetical protein